MFDGTSAEWRDVHDELCTVSLFNPGGPRVAIVEDADPFVTTYRVRLEDYLKASKRHGVLVLEVTKWAANTKLYKLVDQHALQVECRLPQRSAGRQKVVDSKRMAEWLVNWGQSEHNVKVAKNAAQLLLELIGPEFGLLDQELARLALYTDKSGKVTESLVREYGGGWRAKTAWELIEAALDGQGANALRSWIVCCSVVSIPTRCLVRSAGRFAASPRPHVSTSVLCDSGAACDCLKRWSKAGSTPGSRTPCGRRNSRSSNSDNNVPASCTSGCWKPISP